jgi:DNA repair protein RadC
VSIKDWPTGEKLIQSNAVALSDAELLGILTLCWCLMGFRLWI